MKSSITIVRPGDKVNLHHVDAGDTGSLHSKEGAEAALPKIRKKLEKLQEALYAEHTQSLLILLQAMDTGGKDGTVKSVLSGVNPSGVVVSSFKAPTPEEHDHDFLWRLHKATPARGMIAVWNRSQYEDVLIARVHKLVPRHVWHKRYHDINNFEKLLTDNGTTILKFYLHISKDEQKSRLEARLEDPDKHWKFSFGDLEERKLWKQYQEAYQAAINECSTDCAPWYIVPANHKWSRDVMIAHAVVEALEKMKPRYPKVDIDPEKIFIK